MTEEEIIASGKLELYVTGSLPAKEVMEVEDAMARYPNVVREVEEIEKALIQLSEKNTVTPTASILQRILQSIHGVKKLPSSAKKPTNWLGITGWAATIVCLIGLFWMQKQTDTLKETIEVTTQENTNLREQIVANKVLLASTQEMLDIVRSNDYEAITLSGQAVAPNAYATVYFNAKDHIAYIDAKGLPTPPRDKVYQVWSLTMNPLTPTSIGVLEQFDQVDSLFFKVENISTLEAFGITLEPEGGSKTPTLSQLYALGTIAP